MNVFIVGRSIPEKNKDSTGGFEYIQAKELNKHGLKITYLFTDTRSIKKIHQIGSEKRNIEIPIYGAFLPIGGIPYSLYSRLKFKLFKRVWKQAIEENGKPDLVHFHFPLITCNELIFDFLKQQNIKIVVTEHWSRVKSDDLKPQWRTFLNKIVKEADGVIVVSDDLKNSIQTITNSEREIIVVPNMVNSSFEYQDYSIQNTQSFKFFALGRLIPGKNFDLLIEAFSESFKDKAGVFLEIAGEGPERAHLEKLIKKLGLENQVSLLGWVENSRVGDLISEAQVLVVPSSFETFGVPIIEGWSLGKPVIASDNNPLKKYFANNNGILFIKEDLNSLGQALISCYGSYEKFNGKSISEEAEQNFSSTKICNQLEKIYSRLVINKRDKIEKTKS